jgi:hypothetical protein
MRIVLLVALAACTSPQPIREGEARIAFDAADRGSATYRVIGGEQEDGFCAHGDHFTPLTGADVRFGPSGGTLTPLAESATRGTYTATGETTYAPSYQFSIDDEVFELASPPYFSASVKPMSATQALVEFSEATAPSDVTIRMPDGRQTSRTLVGSPAVIDADFSKSGTYRLDLLRKVESDFGVVAIQQTVRLTVP